MRRIIKIAAITLGKITLTTALIMGGAAASDSNQPGKSTKAPALRVTTQTLSELEVESEYSAPATIVSLNNSSISAEIQGRAIKIRAEVGDQIQKGKLLVELDCRSYVNQRKQALAALKLSKTQRDFARKQYARHQRLLRRGALARESYDKAQSDLSISAADIELKQTNVEAADLAISKCKIYAPFSGQVTAKYVQQGQLITPGTPLVQLLQTGKLEVEAELSSNELIKIRNSPNIRFTTATTSQPVTIRSVIRQLNASSNTLRVRLNIPVNDSVIAGLNGRLKWRDDRHKIPPEFLVQRDHKLGVMLEIDGKARFHPLPTAREGQPAEINLPTSSRIIIVNRYSVQDGQAVTTK
ncbi:MAG: hypothetical protein CSB47_00985 [Proteobacteria bacterium]|nr:MAG: hypothetical protein CSB47_00985 [Pseudomonadota bacterium]